MFHLKVICVTTLVIVFSFLQAQDCGLNISTADDQIICEPGCVDLMGEIDGDYLFFEWTNEQGYSNSTNLNPCGPVDENTTFTLSVSALDPQNLVENGDFESGNVGFTSEYMFNPGTGLGGLGQGWYNLDVVSPFLWTNCDSPSGIMMVVNGATVPNVNVYCTEVDVTPNTDYVFTADVMNINNPPPILQFSINGELLGNPFVGGTPCDTELFYEAWNSGSASTATICIVNQSTVASGNDFSLDNITFQELCVVEASFDVIISSPSLELFTDLELIDCNNSIAELYGDADPIDSYDYQWSTEDGNIIGNDQSISVTVDQGGTYSLEVTNEFGCSDTQEIVIEDDFIPISIDVEIPDTLSCSNPFVTLNLIAPDAEQIEWINPIGVTVATDVFSYDTDIEGLHTLEAIGPNGCLASATIEVVSDLEPPLITISSSGQLDCNNASVELLAMSNDSIIQYAWSNSSEEENIFITEAGIYAVTVTSVNGCVDSAAIEVVNEAIAFEFNLVDSTLDCSHAELIYDPGLLGSYESSTWVLPDGSVMMAAEILVESAGTYFFTVTDSNDCLVMDSMIISIDTLRPDLDYSIDSISCNQPGSISIVTDGNSEIAWTIGQQLILDSLIVYSDTIQEVNLLLTGGNGCTTSASFEFVSNESVPQFELSGSQIDCTNPVGLIEVSSSQDLGYSWLGPMDFVSNANQFSVTDGGSYYLTVTNDQGCVELDSFLIEVDTIAPTAEIHVTQLDCWNESASIEIDQPAPGILVNWIHEGAVLAQEGNIFFPPQEGIYELELTNPTNGCSHNIDAEINPYISLAAELRTEDPNCLIDYGMLEILDIHGGQPPYSWTIDEGQNYTSDYFITNLESGAYTFQLLDDEGCSFESSFVIEEADTLAFSLQDQIVLNTGEQVMVDLSFSNPNIQIETINWSPAELFSCSDCLEPIFLGSESTIVTLSIVDSNGCAAERSIVIEVPFIYWLELPNIFSPHKTGGINDNFYPFSSLEGIVQIEYMFIYDRWGNLVFTNYAFQTNDATEGWDGKFLSQELNPGVFTYVLQAQLGNGEFIVRAGDVSLVD